MKLPQIILDDKYTQGYYEAYLQSAVLFFGDMPYSKYWLNKVQVLAEQTAKKEVVNNALAAVIGMTVHVNTGTLIKDKNTGDDVNYLGYLKDKFPEVTVRQSTEFMVTNASIFKDILSRSDAVKEQCYVYYYTLGELPYCNSDIEFGRWSKTLTAKEIDFSNRDAIVNAFNILKHIGAVGPTIYPVGANVHYPVSFDLKARTSNIKEIHSQASDLSVVASNLPKIKVSGTVVTYEDGVAIKDRAKEMLQKTDKFHYWSPDDTISVDGNAYGADRFRFVGNFYGTEHVGYACDNSDHNYSGAVIRKVLVENNVRVACMQKNGGYSNSNWALAVDPSNSVVYNTLDPGQPAYHWVNTGMGSKEVTIVLGSLAGPQLSVVSNWNNIKLRNTARRLAGNRKNLLVKQEWEVDESRFNVVKKSDYRRIIVRLYVLNRRGSARLLQLASGGSSNLIGDKSLASLYKSSIATENKRISFNDILYERDKLNYQGQTVSMCVTDWNSSDPDIPMTVPVPYWLGNVMSENVAEITFDRIMESVCHFGASHVDVSHNFIPNMNFLQDSSGSDLYGQVSVEMVEFTLGEVVAELSVGASPYTVNGIKINKSDIEEVLHRAFMFRKQKDYNNFLKDVRRMSLPQRNMVARGVNVGISVTGGRALFKFVQGKGNKALLKSKHGEFSVGNVKYLYDRENQSMEPPELQQFLHRLVRIPTKNTPKSSRWSLKFLKKKAEKAKYVTHNQLVLSLLREAVDNNRVMEKSLAEARDRAVIVTQAKAGMLKTPDGAGIGGYHIKGTLDDYLISTEPGTFANVYRYKTGEYICMVDKVEYTFDEQKLVSRMFVLRNDKQLAGAIDTL